MIGYAVYKCDGRRLHCSSHILLRRISFLFYLASPASCHSSAFDMVGDSSCERKTAPNCKIAEPLESNVNWKVRDDSRRYVATSSVAGDTENEDDCRGTEA